MNGTDALFAGYSREKRGMPCMSNEEDAPLVTYNRVDGKAFFVFQRRRYDLPGQYRSLSDAQYVAEKQCRSMGWQRDEP